MQDLSSLVSEAEQSFAAVRSPDALEQAKAVYLGKEGRLTALMKQMAGLSPEEKKRTGAAFNQAKQAVEAALNKRREELREDLLSSQLAAEALDVSLPGRKRPAGGIHPVTRSLQRIETLFQSIGFSVAHGPEIESDYFNFTALNTPIDHPARSMHDTFYLLDQSGHVAPDVLMRTHTSPIQARYMRQHVQRYRNEEHMPEIRIIAPGRVYRVDSDATHSPMFHQVEGLWIGESVSFADLKSVIADFLRRFFETDDLAVRFRPSFFPFTEPSAEIDVAFPDGANRGKWLEICGCGMVHPNVLNEADIDSERYTGFAFGFGPDRLTMLRYGVDDLRLFFEGDLRFLKQFN